MDTPSIGNRGAVHKSLVADILARFPNAQTTGFMKALKALPDAIYTADVMGDPSYRKLAGMIPDAYLIDADRKGVVVFEAIDKNDLDAVKLGRIMDLAFVLDEDYWDLALVTVTVGGWTTYAPLDLYSRVQLHKIANPGSDQWLREWKLWSVAA